MNQRALNWIAHVRADTTEYTNVQCLIRRDSAVLADATGTILQRQDVATMQLDSQQATIRFANGDEWTVTNASGRAANAGGARPCGCS